MRIKSRLFGLLTVCLLPAAAASSETGIETGFDPVADDYARGWQRAHSSLHLGFVRLPEMMYSGGATLAAELYGEIPLAAHRSVLLGLSAASVDERRHYWRDPDADTPWGSLDNDKSWYLGAVAAYRAYPMEWWRGFFMGPQLEVGRSRTWDPSYSKSSSTATGKAAASEDVWDRYPFPGRPEAGLPGNQSRWTHSEGFLIAPSWEMGTKLNFGHMQLALSFLFGPRLTRIQAFYDDATSVSHWDIGSSLLRQGSLSCGYAF